jgi:hypothetical protein
MEKTKLTKEEKFKKYANLRLNSALNAIRLLGNLSNKNAYEFTEEQVKTINNELNKAVTETKKRFEKSKKGKKSKNEFF